MLERIERLALGVDGLNALMREHVEQLGMNRVNAIDELLKVVGKLLAAGMVDRALDIVDHRQQRGDKLLGRALALGDALVGGAATEVLPVGLQTGGALGGVLCLVLGGLLSLCRSIELIAHVGKLFLSLLELELKVVVGGFFTGADSGFHHLVLGHRRLLVGILYLVLGSLGGRGLVGLGNVCGLYGNLHVLLLRVNGGGASGGRLRASFTGGHDYLSSSSTTS